MQARANIRIVAIFLLHQVRAVGDSDALEDAKCSARLSDVIDGEKR